MTHPLSTKNTSFLFVLYPVCGHLQPPLYLSTPPEKNIQMGNQVPLEKRRKPSDLCVLPSFEKENKLFCLFLLGMLALSFTGGNMAGERPSHGRLPTLDKFTQGSGKSPRISVSAVSSWSSVSCKLTDAETTIPSPLCGKMRFNRWKIPQVDNGF